MNTGTQGTESGPGVEIHPTESEPGAISDSATGDWPTLRERIEVAARAAHDHQIAYRAELERRDELLCDAFDHALALPREIATAASISETNLYRIVSNAG